LGIGVIELNLSIKGKIPSSSDLLKRSHNGWPIIDLNSNKKCTERPSRPNVFER
jgi:hypothetical protein